MSTVPGVYVKENNDLRLAVTTGATAVPAFVCAKADFGGTAHYKKFNSWLAVNEGLSPAGKANAIFYALQIYFENGGGYCYAIDHANIGAALDQLDDVTLLVQAGSNSAEKIKLASDERRVFGIYDAIQTGGDGAPLSVPVANASMQGAAYGPVLKRGTQSYAASAAVAGVYCRVDRDRGVWKAPANVAIEGGYSVVPLSENPDTESGVNVIRAFNAGAPLVWGARTLDPANERWRFVPVRRLFNAVEKDIKKAMSVAVFEPNNAYTWEVVRSAIDNYLHQLWMDGALLGETPEAAYSVLLGLGVTMTDDDLRTGQMKVKVGLAAVRPAEQIILQFSQKMNGA